MENLAKAAALRAAATADAELVVRDVLIEDAEVAGGHALNAPLPLPLPLPLLGTDGAFRGGWEIGGGWHVILSDSPDLGGINLKFMRG